MSFGFVFSGGIEDPVHELRSRELRPRVVDRGLQEIFFQIATAAATRFDPRCRGPWGCPGPLGSPGSPDVPLDDLSAKPWLLDPVIVKTEADFFAVIDTFLETLVVRLPSVEAADDPAENDVVTTGVGATAVDATVLEHDPLHPPPRTLLARDGTAAHRALIKRYGVRTGLGLPRSSTTEQGGKGGPRELYEELFLELYKDGHKLMAALLWPNSPKFGLDVVELMKKYFFEFFTLVSHEDVWVFHEERSHDCHNRRTECR